MIRDGEQKRIAGREVVPRRSSWSWPRATGCRPTRGACRCSQPFGRRVAADRRIGAGAQGGRARRNGRWRRPGGDDLPFVFSGTLVVRARGLPGCGRRASSTEMGKIGKSLQTVEPEETPLQKETGRLVRTWRAWRPALCARWWSWSTG